ncbi:hypothetical protein F2P79_003149 [Pimephales promelas]|nr:hypothetical protein F2P79_003149 [Pimephales promelas]
MSAFISLLNSLRLFFVLLLFVFLPPFLPFHHLCYFQALTLSISPKTCLAETELGGSFLYLSHTLSFSLFLTHYP